jgi:hydrophobe/amphiphile efflux-1 (HAE1) family protein
MKITQTLLKRPVAVTVVTIAVLFVGLFSLKNLDVDYLPEITYPMIKVHAWWRGATPEEIETNVADPVERIIATVDNLDYMESSSIEGMYTLLVNFRYGVNVDTAYQDVLAAMGRVARKLPRSMDAPIVIKADPSQLPVMQLTISSDRYDLVWLRNWVDNWLSDRITTINGTAGVEAVGGLSREIRVYLDPERLAAYGISPATVVTLLDSENREAFSGRVTVKTREIIARTIAEFESLSEIRNLVVKRTPEGRVIYLKDIAEVLDSHEEMRVNTRFNGKPCVKLNVLKQAEANTVAVSRAVNEGLKQLKTEFPDGVSVNIVENQGTYVMGAIQSVESSAVLAAILVIFVVYLFLGRWRQVLVMVVALPVTLLANFFIMKMAGFSINLFSLGGLVVALGVILDNSIVVLENMTRLKKKGESQWAVKGVSEVGSAIIASTLTFLALFLPFLFVPGLSALLFKELVLVVAGIVIVSLIVALTLTPVLTRALIKGGESGKMSAIAGRFDRVMNTLTQVYSQLLQLCLTHKWKTVLTCVLVFSAGIFLAGKAGSEFLPKVDDGRVMVKLKMPSGTAVSEIDRILMQLEEKIRDLPEIESIFTLAGGKVWGLYTYEIANEGELDVQLVPKSRRSISTEEFIKKIKPMVGKIKVPGAKIPVMQMKIKGIRKVGDQEVEIKIKGARIQPIFEFAREMAARLKETPGLTNVTLSMDMSKPEYRIYIDRAKASALGITVKEAADTLQGLVQGSVATRYREGADYYDIRVMVPSESLKSKFELENLIIKSNSDQPVYVKDIARVERSTGPVEIIHEDQAKQIIVRADSQGISVGEAVARAELAVGQIQKPAGVSFEMGGQAKMMADNRKAMGLIFGFAVLFAYVILAIQFESFLLPMLMMINIPLSLTGAFLALYLTVTPIGVTVLIGLIVMMGGITSQGVVLLSLAESFRSQGDTAAAAVGLAAPLRIRPILMTQLTTILGLVPLALNLGSGGDMLQPMAIAVIGGLTYSLLLTLLFLPVAYSIAMDRKERWKTEDKLITKTARVSGRSTQLN